MVQPLLGVLHRSPRRDDDPPKNPRTRLPNARRPGPGGATEPALTAGSITGSCGSVLGGRIGARSSQGRKHGSYRTRPQPAPSTSSGIRAHRNPVDKTIGSACATRPLFRSRTQPERSHSMSRSAPTSRSVAEPRPHRPASGRRPKPAPNARTRPWPKWSECTLG